MCAGRPSAAAADHVQTLNPKPYLQLLHLLPAVVLPQLDQLRVVLPRTVRNQTRNLPKAFDT